MENLDERYFANRLLNFSKSNSFVSIFSASNPILYPLPSSPKILPQPPILYDLFFIFPNKIEPVPQISNNPSSPPNAPYLEISVSVSTIRLLNPRMLLTIFLNFFLSFSYLAPATPIQIPLQFVKVNFLCFNIDSIASQI